HQHTSPSLSTRITYSPTATRATCSSGMLLCSPTPRLMESPSFWARAGKARSARERRRIRVMPATLRERVPGAHRTTGAALADEEGGHRPGGDGARVRHVSRAFPAAQDRPDPLQDRLDSAGERDEDEDGTGARPPGGGSRDRAELDVA